MLSANDLPIQLWYSRSYSYANFNWVCTLLTHNKVAKSLHWKLTLTATAGSRRWPSCWNVHGAGLPAEMSTKLAFLLKWAWSWPSCWYEHEVGLPAKMSMELAFQQKWAWSWPSCWNEHGVGLPAKCAWSSLAWMVLGWRPEVEVAGPTLATLICLLLSCKTEIRALAIHWRYNKSLCKPATKDCKLMV